MLCALQADSERVYVYWRGTFCYVKRSDVELTGVPEQAYPSGTINAEGKRKNAVVRGYRQPDPSGRHATEWPVGTELYILDHADGFCLAVGLGCRGWIPEEELLWYNDGD